MLVIGAGPVGVIPDLLFVVIASHGFAVSPPGKSTRSRPASAAYVTPRQAAEIALQISWIVGWRPNSCTICVRKCASVQAARMHLFFLLDNKGLSCLVVWRIACSHERRKDRVQEFA